MNEVEMKIQQYAQEIGVSEMTVDQMIDSHRRLREANKVRHEEWLNELTKAREIGRQQSVDEVKNYGWISKERLQSMTMAEIAEWVRED